MIMENYSPSHPTDDMDIDDTEEIFPRIFTNNVTQKETVPIENLIVNNWKPVDSLEGDLNDFNENESSAWNKELSSIEPDIVSKTQHIKSPTRTFKRSRSKSTEKRSVSKTNLRRSRSRSGRKRSRSRNKRSRSKSGHRRRRSRSGPRRSKSRSNSRNRRSRSRNKNIRNDSRNGNNRSFGRDKETKRTKSRSKSPIQKFSSKETKRIDTNISSRSPDCHSSVDRKDDNIFNKLTELRTLPISSSPKEKWGCDSDEETTSAAKPVQNSFPDNRGRSTNYGERSSRDRQDFRDQRGRGFQSRGAPWSQGRPNYRNDNVNERDSRTQNWGQPRQDFSGERNFDKRTPPVVNPKQNFGAERNFDRGTPPVVVPKHNKNSDDESDNWGKKDESKIEEPRVHVNSQSNINPVKTDAFAADSDEEFGAWGKELKGDRSPAKEVELESKPPIRAAQEPRGGWGGDADNQRQRGPPPREANQGGFSAWKNAQKPDSQTKPLPADNSDDEFGAWGNEKKGGVGATKTDSGDECGGWGKEGEKRGGGGPAKGALDDEFGAWGNEKKQGGGGGSKAPVDSDEECGAWGNEQRSTKTVSNDFQDSSRDDDQFVPEQRGSFQSRGGFNNNQPYGQRRGGGGHRNFGGSDGPRNFGGSDGQRNFSGARGPRNFDNNRFQRPPSQDRFYGGNQSYHADNDSNNSFSGGYNNNNYNSKPPAQTVQPNYSYKPPQMPQWASQPQGGQLPFPIDTSVCPPIGLMSHQMPFIPPPPPHMEGRGQSVGPVGMLAMLGVGTQGHPLALNQAAMTIGQMGQSAMSMPQMHQSAMTMGQSAMSLPQMNQSAMTMGQSAMSMPQMNQSAMTMGQIGQSSMTMPQINQSSSNMPLAANSVLDKNLLETLMSTAGLPSDTLRMDIKQSSDSSMSVSDKFNTILKTAASSIFSRLVESSAQKTAPPVASDNMSMSPPSPPSTSPPHAIAQAMAATTAARYGGNHPSQQSTTSSTFVPPPLPNYSDVLKPSTNKMTIVAAPAKPSSNNPDEEKRNRSDFDSKLEWQERVAVEVKLFLKPAYMSRSIDKNDYKEIMKRCVTKITRSGVTEINSDKIEKFVLSYVEKYNKNRKVKQHSTVSSSEHDLRCD